MAKYTPNLNLYEKEPDADGTDTFDIQTMLNDNFDKIDAAVAGEGRESTIIKGLYSNKVDWDNYNTTVTISYKAGAKAVILCPATSNSPEFEAWFMTPLILVRPDADLSDGATRATKNGAMFMLDSTFKKGVVDITWYEDHVTISYTDLEDRRYGIPDGGYVVIY